MLQPSGQNHIPRGLYLRLYQIILEEALGIAYEQLARLDKKGKSTEVERQRERERE